MELEVTPPERRRLGAAQQPVPYHLQECHIHSSPHREGLGLLAPALARVDLLYPRRGLDRCQAQPSGGEALALHLHQVLDVTADVRRRCQQPSTAVLDAPVGEVLPAGDVRAPGVGGPVAGLGVGENVGLGRGGGRSLRRRQKERWRSLGNVRGLASSVSVVMALQRRRAAGHQGHRLP